MTGSNRQQIAQAFMDEDRANRQTEKEILMNFIKNIDDKSEWIEKSNPSKHPDLYGNAILFVGSTKQGKSTLINCLLENDLTCRYDVATDDWLLENNKNASNNEPRIAGIGQSETLWPTAYKKNNIKIWDMPGLNDNRSFKIELKQAAMSRIVITQHKSVSFVLVIEQSILSKQDPMQLVELINLLLEYSPDIAQHLFIVVSKSTKDNWKVLLNKLIVWTPSLQNENTIKINRAKKVVQHVINENAGYSFMMPNFKDEDVTYTYNFPDKELINKIADIEKINIANCPYVLNKNCLVPIVNLVGDISIQNKRKLSNLCLYFINESEENVRKCNGWKKEEQLRYIEGFKKILPEDTIQLVPFLEFVANNTSSGRNREYYRIINDLKIDFVVLTKISEIFNSNGSIQCELLNDVKNTIVHVRNFLNVYQEEVSNRATPQYPCIIQ